MFSKLDSEPRDGTEDQWKITEIHTYTHIRTHKFPVSIEMWKRVIPNGREPISIRSARFNFRNA